MQMRIIAWMGAIVAVAAGGMALDGAREARAEGSAKTLTLVGPNGLTSRNPLPISGFVMTTQPGNPGTSGLMISAGANECSIQFSSATDAAAILARLEDAKATQVACQGSALTRAVPGFGTMSYIPAATNVSVMVNP
jgi:hypothetical protein